jgi:hypothetical protein
MLDVISSISNTRAKMRSPPLSKIGVNNAYSMLATMSACMLESSYNYKKMTLIFR